MNTEIFEEQARKEYASFCLIADKVEADPSLLRVPLENIERWCARGIWAQDMLGMWKSKIEEARMSPKGLRHLLAILRDDSEDMRYFKGFSPMVGILSREESARFL